MPKKMLQGAPKTQLDTKLGPCVPPFQPRTGQATRACHAACYCSSNPLLFEELRSRRGWTETGNLSKVGMVWERVRSSRRARRSKRRVATPKRNVRSIKSDPGPKDMERGPKKCFPNKTHTNTKTSSSFNLKETAQKHVRIHDPHVMYLCSINYLY